MEECLDGALHNGWTSQDDADYDVYKAYGWEQPDFKPPAHVRTHSGSTTSSSKGSSHIGDKSIKKRGREGVLNRTKRLQHLRDACQNLCESVHRGDLALFSISALKGENIERYKYGAV